MDKKYQVFISSTYTDLIIERQEVVEAVLNAGHIPAGMELFKAGPTQEEIIREWIEESDIYVLILGPRYGSLNDEGISYTQWEYNLAKELGKPMFSIVLNDPYMESMVPDRVKAGEFETTNPKYQEFRAEVMSSLVAPINHIAEIRGRVSDSIRDIERRTPEKLEGWIKGSYLVELNELRKENKKLTEKLIHSQEEVIEEKKKNSAIKDEYIGDVSFDYLKQKMKDTKIPDELIKFGLEDAETDVRDMDRGYFRAFVIRDKNLMEKIIEFYKSDEPSIFTWLMLYKDRIRTNGYGMIKNKREEIMKYAIIPFFSQHKLAILEDVIRTDPSKRPLYDKMKFTDLGFKFLTMLEMEEEHTK